MTIGLQSGTARDHSRQDFNRLRREFSPGVLISQTSHSPSQPVCFSGADDVFAALQRAEQQEKPKLDALRREFLEKKVSIPIFVNVPKGASPTGHIDFDGRTILEVLNAEPGGMILLSYITSRRSVETPGEGILLTLLSQRGQTNMQRWFAGLGALSDLINEAARLDLLRQLAPNSSLLTIILTDAGRQLLEEGLS